MKIHSSAPARATVKTKQVKKRHVVGNGFRSLLQEHIEEITQTHAIVDAKRKIPCAPGTWQIIEDAASLLDSAMEEILRKGAPNPDTVRLLQGLRKRLACEGQPDDGREVDAIIAVETSRLGDWES